MRAIEGGGGDEGEGEVGGAGLGVVMGVDMVRWWGGVGWVVVVG